MKRSDVLKEIKRENTTRRRVFPGWIQINKIAEGTAKRRLDSTELIEKLLEVMTDREFTKLCERLEAKPEVIQAELFQH